MRSTSNANISLTAQGIWLLVAKIISFGLGILLPFLVVRYLPRDAVGVYKQAFLVILNGAAIIPLGFSMSAFYFLNREEKRREMAVANILVFNLLVGGLTFLALFLFPELLGRLFRDEEIVRLAPRIGLVIWLWIFASFLEVLPVANQEAKIATLFIISSQFTKTAMMIGAVVMFQTVDAIILAALIQSVLQIILLFIYISYKFPRIFKQFSVAFFWEQFAYAVPFGIAGVIYTLTVDIHYYFVGYHFSAAEYAVYAYGCFQLPLVGILSESAASILIPRMNELQSRSDLREMLILTVRAMRKLSFVYFPMYIFLVITAGTFVTTLFTSDFVESVPIFVINLTLLPFSVLLLDPIVRSFKEFGRRLIMIRIFTVTALVFGLWQGTQTLGMIGVISIVVTVTLIQRAIEAVMVLRKLDVERGDYRLLADVLKAAFISGLAGLFTYFVYQVAIRISPAMTLRLLALNGTGTSPHTFEFLSGALALASTFLVFVPTYLGLMLWFGMFEDRELQKINRGVSLLILPFKKLRNN